MYEPIRTQSVHSAAPPVPDFPHRTREEELDTQLAAHLTALLTVTDELRAAAGGPRGGGDLDTAAERLVRQIARLRGGRAPERLAPAAPATRRPLDEAGLAALHRRAHALAGRALVVAASRADTVAAILAAERMDAHAAAPRLAATA
ncbi:hypothetical protein RKE29_08745 [Streptomyces sp. B1866]|uniref:SCO4983 family protein n=1 Tax=Streptomyces sp. B1866 TaxID=3075431 RepID=UPI00288FFCE6|nr:hypothetical protein [Streptomyces sp. B1866]MDT3396726.1 hypothetical protein [Streptomyces sp. B1866]